MANYELPFSKWLCDWAWDNRMPYAYSTDLRNVRIVNQVTTVRKGYKTVIDDIVWTTIKGMASNNWNLYVAVDSKLKSCDLTNWNFTNIGNLPNDDNIWMITFGKYTIILTGNTPFVYDWSILTAITTAVKNSPLTTSFVWTWLNDFSIIQNYNTDWLHHTYSIVIDSTWWTDTFKWNQDWWTFTTWVAITWSNQTLTNWVIIKFNAITWHVLNDKWDLVQLTNSNPIFWTEFLNFTWVVWTWDFSNIIYQSRPITAANQEYSYDWKWSWAGQIIMKSNILWLIATLSKLIIFTEKSIEYIDRNSYTTIWWVLNFYPNPLAQWEKLANSRSIVSAWDKVFFLTADKKIKTIDYIQGIDDLRVWELSDDEKVGIPNFMNSLNDDLSKSVWFYDQKNKLIKFFVRSKNSITNDICIIWDLVNKTFLPDDNKFYGILVNHNNKVYAWSCLNSIVYEDEFWTDDDWWEISWYRYSAILANWRQTKNKMYNWVCTTWTINSTTQITKEIILDWDIIDSSVIEKQESIIGGTASASTGQIMTWWPTSFSTLKNFTKDRWSEYLNSIWRYLQIKYSGSRVWQDFTLETIETKEKLSAYEELTDK